MVELYRSLGGGWEIREGHDIVPAATKEQMAARTNWGGILKTEEHYPPETKSQNTHQLYSPQW